MGKKHVVLSLAICLVLSIFHEVSCQIEEKMDFIPLDGPERQVINQEVFSDVDNSEIQSEAGSGQCLADETQCSTEGASMGSRQQFETKKSNGGSVTFMASRAGIGQRGSWRCFGQEKNGVREDEEFPIVLTEYAVDDIIKEESTCEGSASNTSSLIASLIKLVEKHKTESLFQKKRKLRTTLKGYRNMKVSELVARSDFEEILSMAARFEELTSASVSYIARLSMYASVIKNEPKAVNRTQLAQRRATFLLEMANEKRKRVDAELELAKALAREGDMLHVKIFAMKKAMVKFEAKKEEVEKSLQKIVVNVSGLIDEAAQAFEEHREWKEKVKPSLEYSYDDMESAEIAWASFLNTL